MPGETSHFEIGVPDARRARSFFGSLLGWDYEDTSGDNAWIQTGGVRGGLHGGNASPGITVYFEVPDIASAVQRVRELGGHVDDDGAEEANGERFVPCRDDQGVAFGLHQRASRER